MIYNRPFLLPSKIIYALVVYVFLIGMPVNIYRIGGGDIGYYQHILILTALFAALSNIPNMRILSRKEFGFIVFYIFFIVYSLSLGLMNHELYLVIDSLKYYLLGFFVVLALIGQPLNLELLHSKRLWTSILFIHFLCVIYFYSFMYGKYYPGIGVQSIAYASIYYFIYGYKIMFLFSIILMVFEAKRSILLSSLVVIALLIFIRRSVKKSKLPLFKLMIAFWASLFILIFVLYLISMLPESSLVNRINLINPFSDSFDVMLGSSGRAGELVSFFGSIDDVYSLVSGSGFGFQYQWDLGFNNAQSGEIKPYFHMSIFNYIATAGVVGLFLWFLFFRNSILLLKSKIDRSTLLVFSFVLFSLIQSFFGFVSAIDPFFWLMMFFALKYKSA